MEGKLHVYHPKRHLNLFEYTPSRTSAPRPNVLLFVGGLFDNFRTTEYVGDLSTLFPSPSSWRVLHVQLSSAIRSWGMFDLNRDVDEIATCIDYIRSTPALGDSSTSVVLMGHSTGCQDTFRYIHSASASSKPRPKIQGAILQAPASDRESILETTSKDPSAFTAYQKCLDMIASTPESEHRTTILPMHWTTPLLGPAPINITRFLSLASPDSPENPSLDDLFSSDLPDSRLLSTFGRIGDPSSSPLQPSHVATTSNEKAKPSMLILVSENDEYVPRHISKPALLTRWKTAIESNDSAILDPSSTIIQHGIHDLGGSSVEARTARLVTMRKAVLEYLDRAVGGVGAESWRVWEEDKEKILASSGDGGSTAKPESDAGIEKGVGGLKL